MHTHLDRKAATFSHDRRFGLLFAHNHIPYMYNLSTFTLGLLYMKESMKYVRCFVYMDVS